MTIRDVMKKRLVTVEPEDPFHLALQVLLWSGVRHLPVVSGDRVVGILTERDILRARAEPPGGKLLADLKVLDVMNAPIQSASPDDDVNEAATRMVSHRIGCLPVIEDDALIGIVTRTDVLAAAVQPPAAETSASEGDGPSVESVMTPSPATVKAGDDLLDAVARMAQLGVRHLPVVDGDRRVVGMLSDRDVRTLVGDPARAPWTEEGGVRVKSMKVGDVMTEDVMVAERGVPVSEVSHFFADAGIGALPVVDDDDRLLGIVSYVDVLRYFAEG
jgi:CBS domain-containing protein